MAEKRIFMVMGFTLFSTMFAAGVFAQVTVSGGFALSSVSSDKSSAEAKTGFGLNVYADYLLPVNIPLSLGFEAGYDTASIKYTSTQYDGYSYYEYEETVKVGVIPLLVRAAYHFDLMASLDLYLVGKVGYAFEVWEGDFFVQEPDTFTFGFDVGAAYYLSPVLGIFAEAGYDIYGDYFHRFLTVGFSTKFYQIKDKK